MNKLEIQIEGLIKKNLHLEVKLNSIEAVAKKLLDILEIELDEEYPNTIEAAKDTLEVS